MQHLAAHVEERVVAADRVARDDHALDEVLRAGHHERDVLAGPRLGLVRVDDEVARAAVRRGQEAPLHARREAGAAAAAQAGVLDHGDDVTGAASSGHCAGPGSRPRPRRSPASTSGRRPTCP